MEDKILIDLNLLRQHQNKNRDFADGYLLTDHQVLKSIRELAAFKYTCRKCEDAPCINICPKNALEKDDEGIVQRSVNLCVSCKSCVVACPFGTLMNDFFEHTRGGHKYFDLSDEEEIDQLIASSPPGVIKRISAGEYEENNIIQYNENILVKEIVWDK